MALLAHLKVAALAVACLWAAQLIATLVPLTRFGIRPRSAAGLIGIVTAPFIHGGFAHLLANSSGLLVLLTLLLSFERRQTPLILAGIWLLSGGFVWLFGGSRTVHIGASGIVYGLIGFFIAYGFYSRKPLAMVVSLATLIVYGGAVHGIIPQGSRMSWEAHLGGFLSGLALAALRFRI